MASIQKRPNGKWRARYRDPAGKEHAAHFDRKADAQRWLDQVTADIVRGAYVDPRAGRVVFGAFARDWLAAQTFDPSTREAVEVRLRVHILPTLGDLELRAIRPSTVQAWLRSRQEHCSPRYVKTMLAHVSSILGAAVEDGLIARNACSSKSVRAPRAEQSRIVPWTADQVTAVVAAHPLRYRAVPVAAAGCGLRQGEVFGLRVEDVDFLRRRLLVRQQVKLLSGQPVLGAPKGGKSREVPLPEAVAVALAERLRRFPAAADGLVFTSRERKPLARTYYNQHIWKRPSGPPGSHRSGRTVCTHSGTSTPRSSWTVASRSGRSRTTSATPTPVHTAGLHTPHPVLGRPGPGGHRPSAWRLEGMSY